MASEHPNNNAWMRFRLSNSDGNQRSQHDRRLPFLLQLCLTRSLHTPTLQRARIQHKSKYNVSRTNVINFRRTLSGDVWFAMRVTSTASYVLNVAALEIMPSWDPVNAKWWACLLLNRHQLQDEILFGDGQSVPTAAAASASPITNTAVARSLEAEMAASVPQRSASIQEKTVTYEEKYLEAKRRVEQEHISSKQACKDMQIDYGHFREYLFPVVITFGSENSIWTSLAKFSISSKAHCRPLLLHSWLKSKGRPKLELALPMHSTTPPSLLASTGRETRRVCHKVQGCDWFNCTFP